jgi:hypothetical protein
MTSHRAVSTAERSAATTSMRSSWWDLTTSSERGELLAPEPSGLAPGGGGGAGSAAAEGEAAWGAAGWPRLRPLTSAMRTTVQSCSRKSTCHHTGGGSLTAAREGGG